MSTTNKLINEAISASLNQSGNRLRTLDVPRKLALVGRSVSVVNNFKNSSKIQDLAKKVLSQVTDPKNQKLRILEFIVDNPAKELYFNMPVGVSEDGSVSSAEENIKTVIEEFFKFFESEVEGYMKAKGANFKHEIWFTDTYGPGPAYEEVAPESYDEMTAGIAIDSVLKGKPASIRFCVNGFTDDQSMTLIRLAPPVSLDSFTDSRWAKKVFGDVNGYEDFVQEWKKASNA